MTEREQRIIMVKGTIGYLRERITELTLKDGPLEDYQMGIIRDCIKQLRRYEEELMKLEKGG